MSELPVKSKPYGGVIPLQWLLIVVTLFQKRNNCGAVASLSESSSDASRKAQSDELDFDASEDYGAEGDQIASDESSIAPLRDIENCDNAYPDGGAAAWIQVFLMHLVNFNTFGYMLSYGVYQEYYSNTLNLDPSDISWVGTVELFLVYFMGAFSARILDAGYFRAAIHTGHFLQVVGMLCTSFARTYWQFFLAQGICQGIGNGLLFCPAIAHISAYFSPRKRALPLSIVASGGGTGGMVFPAIAYALMRKIGFPHTLRIMTAIVLFNAIVVAIFLKTKLPKSLNTSLVDWSAFQELPFVLFAIGIFFAFWGLYFAYYYVRSFSRDILLLSRGTSFNLLLLVNGLGIPGRIIPALLSDRYFGPVNVIFFLILFGGVLVLLWMTVSSIVWMYVWSALYGFFGGGTQSLFQTSTSSFSSSEVGKAGARLGISFTIVSLAALSGPPIAGKLIDVYEGEYYGAQLFGGIAMVLGALFVLTARFAKTGWLLNARI